MRTFRDTPAVDKSTGRRADAEDGVGAGHGGSATREAEGPGHAHRRGPGVSGVGPRDRAAGIDAAEGDRRCRPVALQGRRRGVCVRAERFTTTELSAEQIHEIGLQQVARIEGEMDAILKKLGRTEGPVRVRIEKLKKDLQYPDPASEASRAAIMRDIDGYIADALKRSPALFDLQPKTPVVAQPFPRFREASAAANYNRAPLDGSRTAIFQIPLRDQRMTKLRAAHARVPRDRARPSLPDRARAGEHCAAALPPGARARRHFRAVRGLGAVRGKAGRRGTAGTKAIPKACSASSTRSCSARADWSSTRACTRSTGPGSRRSTTASKRARSNATS